MKIVERKDDPRKRIWKGSCLKCGTVMTEVAEALNPVDDRDGPLAPGVCVQCTADFWLYQTDTYES